MILFSTLHGGGTLLIWGIKHHIGDEVTLCDHFNHYFLFQFSLNRCVYALLLSKSFFIRWKKIDVEMAKDRAYLPCGGDHSSYRIGHLDHITSTDQKEKI